MINFTQQANSPQDQKIKEQNDKLYQPPGFLVKDDGPKKADLAEEISNLNNKLDQLIDLLKNSNSSVRTVVVSQIGEEIQKVKQNENVPMFIPAPSTEGMKINMGDITVKSKSSDLDSSVKKLSKLDKKL